jgi:tRNA(adenine34) deaminase
MKLLEEIEPVKTDEKYMRQALKEANIAYQKNEVPVGAVIVKDGKIISRGHNTREKDHLVISHAEINAIKKASKKLNDWQLVDCVLYVTIEPCPMCAAAIYQSHIKRVVYGAPNIKEGAIDSHVKLYNIEGLHFYPQITRGVLQEECSNVMKEYFKNKRHIK